MSSSPQCIAIVADGNERWAEDRNLPVSDGHRAGADTLEARLRDAVDLGIKEFAIYWSPARNCALADKEGPWSIETVGEPIASAAPRLNDEGVRMRFIGHRDGIAAELVERMAQAEARTAANKRITLFVAFNYGGRAEIVDAARRFEAGSEQAFGTHLYAPEMHDPDLLVRTAGERRLSNGLLWQCAYSELIFRDELWPDFDRTALEECLEEFDARQRRFGARL